ncbi:sugar ABC transporter permease [Rhodobacteraceae bacterium N5(2021)]|uniref:Sugar ABC transporter permease n=1 Tax=Gymnodinialimonas phycosphaerae TaxID=2841589 RepID=A0A975TRY2_9RHOB|nr:sugar ABC transporter permease [Gymnodinialimonas phycosphaerae]MBY4893548.1 sugar ABC transporter permease [Gymnodinialimonas phycosphaerae]
MPHGTFAKFILPSLTAMFLFIALPIVSIIYQSFFIEHEQIMITVEACDPFRCVEEVRIDAEAMIALREEQPAGRFNGLATYTDSAHLAFSEIQRIWSSSPDAWAALDRIFELPFYRALVFTLAYTFIVTPASIGLGFLVALAVNRIPQFFRGAVVYFSLLPMIVPSLLGSLILFWMIDARGIIGSFLQALFNDPELSVKADPVLTWITLFAYGTWSSTPFVFIIFFAALQTVPRDTLEASMVDGASRLDRVRFVVIPHLAPVATFLLVVSIMDNFRVFEAIIGFSAQAHASSLSSLIFNDLRSGEIPLFGSAAATSIMTIFCIGLLMTPSIRRSWTAFQTKT